MKAQIIEERMKQIEGVSLKSGGHDYQDDGEPVDACVMEAVAYVAGEPWSDAPQCACPVITAFLVSWNDALPSDAERDRLLKPLIPRIVGTRSTKAVEERRSYMALDWLIRAYTPKWLDLVPTLSSNSAALRDLEGIVDMAGATAAGATARLASKDAAAAWATARDAAWAAAGAAARDAAGDAAWAAAGDALKPTTEWLQASALRLVNEMIDVVEMQS